MPSDPISRTFTTRACFSSLGAACPQHSGAVFRSADGQHQRGLHLHIATLDVRRTCHVHQRHSTTFSAAAPILLSHFLRSHYCLDKHSRLHSDVRPLISGCASLMPMQLIYQTTASASVWLDAGAMNSVAIHFYFAGSAGSASLNLQWSAVLANGTTVAASAISSMAMWNCPSAAPGAASVVACAGGSTSFKACLPSTFTVCSVLRGAATILTTGAASYDVGSILHSTGAKGSFADVLSVAAPPNYTVGAALNNVAVSSTVMPQGSWFYTCLANTPNAAVAGSSCTLTINGAPVNCSGALASSFSGALAVNHNLFLEKSASWAVAEILVYSRQLSATEIVSVNSYFALKYFIGLRPPAPPFMPPPLPPPPPSPAPPSGQIPATITSGLIARHTAASFRATNSSQWVRFRARLTSQKRIATPITCGLKAWSSA